MQRSYFVALLVLSSSTATLGFAPNTSNDPKVKTANSRVGDQEPTNRSLARPQKPTIQYAPSASPTQMNSIPLEQFSSSASSLFSNMITPASILAGAIVPIGFASGLAFRVDEKESKLATVLRRLFPFLCVASLTSHLVSIMWASVAVNQLAESKIEMAESVWHLLQRDFALPWAAVNSHFVVGMLGFMAVIGIKAFFMANQGLSGMSAAGLAMSGLIMMTSIVNRGVAAGGGPNQRYGTSVLALFSTYVRLLMKRSMHSFGLLEWTGVGMAIASTVGTIMYVVGEVKDVVLDTKTTK